MLGQSSSGLLGRKRMDVRMQLAGVLNAETAFIIRCCWIERHGMRLATLIVALARPIWIGVA